MRFRFVILSFTCAFQTSTKCAAISDRHVPSEIARFASARAIRNVCLRSSKTSGGAVTVKAPRAHICSSDLAVSASRNSTQVILSAIAISGRTSFTCPVSQCRAISRAFS